MLLDPFEHVRPTPMQRTLPPYLTQAEVRSILEVCDLELQLRDRAVLEVLYSSALRIGELGGSICRISTSAAARC